MNETIEKFLFDPTIGKLVTIIVLTIIIIAVSQ